MIFLSCLQNEQKRKETAAEVWVGCQSQTILLIIKILRRQLKKSPKIKFDLSPRVKPDNKVTLTGRPGGVEGSRSRFPD